MQRSSQGARRNWARQTYPHSPLPRSNLRSLSLFSTSSLRTTFSRSHAVSVLSSAPFLARSLLPCALPTLSRSSTLARFVHPAALSLDSVYVSRDAFSFFAWDAASCALPILLSSILNYRWSILSLLLYLFSFPLAYFYVIHTVSIDPSLQSCAQFPIS